MKVVVVGGVAGGASAAARVRRLDESAEIVMLYFAKVSVSSFLFAASLMRTFASASAVPG